MVLDTPENNITKEAVVQEEPTVHDEFWSEPPEDKISKRYYEWKKYRHVPQYILRTESDFNNWWTGINRNLSELGFKDPLSHAIEWIINNKEDKFSLPQEAILIDMIRSTVNNPNFQLDNNDDAKQTLENALKSVNMIKSPIELHEIIKNFTIDYTSKAGVERAKWKVLKLCCDLVNYPVNEKSMVFEQALKFLNEHSRTQDLGQVKLIEENFINKQGTMEEYINQTLGY